MAGSVQGVPGEIIKRFREDFVRALSSPLDAGLNRVISADAELRPALLAAMPMGADETWVIITDSVPRAESIAAELLAVQDVMGVDRVVHLLPELESGPRQMAPAQESERSRVLDLTQTAEGIFIAPVLAALAPTVAPDQFRHAYLTMQTGDRSWPPEALARFLVEQDYDNEAQVHVPGEFAWRGGIVDVFSPAHDYPLRLDFFGDELESIRTFDPETQRSLETLDSCRIIPRSEAGLRAGEEPKWCFLDWIPAARLHLIVDGRVAVEAHLEKFGDDVVHGSFWRKLAALTCPRLIFESPDDAESYPPELVWHPPVFGLNASFRGSMPEIADGFETLQIQLLRHQLGRWKDDGYRFLVACDAPARLEKAMDLLTTEVGLPAESLLPLVAALGQGLYAPEARLAVLTDAELFGRPSSRARRHASPHAYHADHMMHAGGELTEGDLAVHAAYGVCRFQGLRYEPFQDQIQEVLALEFEDDVMVFVPVDQAHLVSRYVGAGRKYPKLSKVGGRAWKNATAAASVAVEDLAAELLRMQALRETTPGFAYNPDDEALHAFEEAFPWTETDDQLHAIHDVQADMAAARPMDRLICGDVGFGKTEVAMRAAFQAVLAGKQVAVLVPTTVLCQQHFLSFRDRFNAYPVIIENLSRFRTGREQRETLEALSEGRVDIIIGTHRLLSLDVVFKDLGLVIVDEEQRFGVQHKERLKALRVNVDLLTLTATPIPRTLYQSMTGLRDMSTIVTPPQERLPVRTVITRYDEALIREAITRELERGGQVFFLHNRVKSIGAMKKKLQTLVPEARFDIGHGQMHEHELEAAMLRFIEGQTDVFVSTTIIESGLDIPNANTIIIDRADMFGLAELYQLRGRVGRYHRQAYAYLMVPDAGLMQADARSRLAAIRKYTQLGAGFKLAMRDLEIRGAGNILGAEQSGHIAAIGFDLYCQLLKTAVDRMQNNMPQRKLSLQLHLPFLVFGTAKDEAHLSAFLPRDYVHEEGLRLTLYRRLADLPANRAVDAFADELRDRFGALPEPVRHLLTVARLRIAAQRLDLHAVTLRDDKLLLEGLKGHLKPDGVHFPRIPPAPPEARLKLVLDTLVALAKRPGATRR